MEPNKIASEALKKLCLDAGSVEDLIEGAKEQGITLAIEQAKTMFDNLQKHKADGKVELTDELLDCVVGGLRAISCKK